MEINKIIETFNSCNSAYSDGEKYNVLSIEGMKHKIGKSEEGFPKVFVLTNPSKTGVTNINAELIAAEFNIDCTVIDDLKETTSAIFSIITLRSNDETLKKIFFDVFMMMLSTLPDKPSDIDLAIKFEGLLSIFAALKRKPIHKIQGLWAELLVIDQSMNPEVVAKAWHNSPGSKYDFTMGTDKIEVKSTSKEDRIHRFSIDQLNPSESSNLLIASVIIRESAKDDNGLSVDDLYQKIRQKVKDIDIRMHIYTVIANTLGDEYEKANTVFFDYATGCDTLAFYDYRDVPRLIKNEMPDFVSGIKFDSNMSHLDNIKEKGLIFDNDSLLSLV